MKKTSLALAILFSAALVALAEMPVTTVTPENAGALEVAFDVRIEPNVRGPLSRVVLRVTPKSADLAGVEPPGLYLFRGEALVGCVAMFASPGKEGERPSYWCDLSPDLVLDSKITVTCRPGKPEEGKDLDAQSMEYVIPLKHYLPKGGSKKPGEGK
ncbi:MAG: hypothetical protein MUC63_09535 [Planctomycetes bacterium]|nr:hypothetical protein [Planctomycetota bacterium]